MAHCPGRGEEIPVGDMTHILLWEQGGVAQVISDNNNNNKLYYQIEKGKKVKLYNIIY